MKLAQFTVAVLCVGMTLVACQKDTKLPGTTKQPVTATEKADDPVSNNIFRVYKEQNTDVIKFNGAQGTQTVTEDGIRISVQGGALRRPDGSPETGMVTMRVFGITGVEDQILGGAPTQSRWVEGGQNGEGGPIATAGAVGIDITNAQGQQLRSEGEGVTVEIPVDPDTGPDPEMTLWDGVPSPNQPRDNVWEPSQDPVEITGETYKFRWTRSGNYNIDKVNGCPGIKTPYKVTITGSPFNNLNTEIYAVTEACAIPGLNVVFSLDMYNATPRFWSANPGANLIVGSTVTFIAVSSVGGQLYYGFTTVTVTPGMTPNISNMTVTTMPALMAYLATF